MVAVPKGLLRVAVEVVVAGVVFNVTVVVDIIGGSGEGFDYVMVVVVRVVVGCAFVVVGAEVCSTIATAGSWNSLTGDPQ